MILTRSFDGAQRARLKDPPAMIGCSRKIWDPLELPRGSLSITYRAVFEF